MFGLNYLPCIYVMSFLIAGSGFYKNISVQIGDTLELRPINDTIAILLGNEICGFVPKEHRVTLPASVTVIEKKALTRYFPILYSIRVHLNPT